LGQSGTNGADRARGGIVFMNDNDSKDAFDLVGMGAKAAPTDN
jgi:hypothetical protein